MEQRESLRTLNFDSNNSIEVITLEELKNTYLEHNISGEPMYNGIYHYDLIDRVGDLCRKHELDYHIEEIFAGQNKRKGYDGVAIAPQREEVYGPKALEAHALRRVFTTIRINDMEDEESNTGLVIGYHQDGIQLAIGPNVKFCHNQCVLSPSKLIQSYGGNERIRSIDKMLDIVSEWLYSFSEDRIRDVNVLKAMKEVNVSYKDTMELIGRLNAIRVAKDSKDTRLKKNDNLGKAYPLNQGQISEFTERYLQECINKETTDMSLWDIYNIATQMYKPGQTDIPAILPQNVAWTEFLITHFNLLTV